MLLGPRPVSRGTRRVCLPLAARRALGWELGARVRVSLGEARRTLVISAAGDTVAEDAGPGIKVRQISSTGQITLPAVMLETIGVEPAATAVYFAPDTHVLHLVPEHRIRVSWA